MKVGDYARSSEGDLGKIVRINNSQDIELENSWVSYDEEDLKSSPNIIDLIQVGDYVNGMQVTRICFDEDGERILNLSNCILELINDDIKSIVTKEMFESMEYKI